MTLGVLNAAGEREFGARILVEVGRCDRSAPVNVRSAGLTGSD